MTIKKIMPLFAIAIAVVLAGTNSGFIDGKNPRTLVMHTFEYTAPGGSFAQADVENNSNWVYTSSTARCNDQTGRACRIFVSDNDVVSSESSQYSLKPGFEITASPGSPSYVTSTDAGSGDEFISNKDGL